MFHNTLHQCPLVPHHCLQLAAYSKTAIAPIIAANNKTNANILFDEGAQHSFISTAMVEELGIPLSSTADISLASFGNASDHTRS